MVKIYRQAVQNVNFGESVVEPKIVKLVLSLQNMLYGFQINIVEALEQSSSKLVILTNEGWKIYFNSDSDDNMGMELVKLISLLSEGLKPEERGDLRYVDLRPKDRAIVCDSSICGD